MVVNLLVSSSWRGPAACREIRDLLRGFGVPVDLWTRSDLESLQAAVVGLSDRIGAGDRWRMTVERRRHRPHHARDLIRALADLVGGTVDLTHPDKILHLDPIGDHTALSVLTPVETFSVMGLQAPIERKAGAPDPKAE